jgi:hypothetical protein
MRPFTTRAVAAGGAITADDLEWRAIPAGLLPAPDLTRPIAAVDLTPGVPLVDAVLRAPAAIPEDWWCIPVPIGVDARPGDQVLLVVTEPPLTVVGLVISPQHGDPYSMGFRPASVAVPAEAAALVAAAGAQGVLVTAVRSGAAPAGG